MDQLLNAAIAEAEQGLKEGGIPIGSVLVHRGRIIGRGHNRRVQRESVVLHAEMDALENAGRQPAAVYRECTLYTTLSPCAMCAGAILHARIRRVVFGAHDPKTGACGSVVDLFAAPRLNHQTKVESGVLAESCGSLLSGFFARRRANASG